MAAGIIEGPDGIVLVQNRRRQGTLDWSTPGGVVEVHEGESITDGLTREVFEETGLLVDAWDGPVYDIEVVAEGLGWTLRVEAFVAVAWRGELSIDDPDGIVVDARFVPREELPEYLSASQPWVREPIDGWLMKRALTAWRYRIDGSAQGATEVFRLHED